MEKFATDLDKLLDEFESEDISSSNIYEFSDSSGYNSLKTSTELYPTDIPIECTTSQISEMNDVAELPTPTCEKENNTLQLAENFSTQDNKIIIPEVVSHECAIVLKDNHDAINVLMLTDQDIQDTITLNGSDNIIEQTDSQFQITTSPAISHVPPKKKLRPNSLFNISDASKTESDLKEDNLTNQTPSLPPQITNSPLNNSSPETSKNTKKSVKRPLSLNLTPPNNGSNIPNIQLNDENLVSESNSSQYSIPVSVENLQLRKEEDISRFSEPTDNNAWQGIPIDELGQREPEWIKDDLKNDCMQCLLPFTMFRRRHHCRACGRLLCGKCCCWRMQLQFSNRFFPKDRVCAVCFQYLIRIEVAKKNKHSSTISSIHPNNSVLKSQSRPQSLAVSPFNNPDNLSITDSLSNSVHSKSVVFFDGIRPGGDLMENKKNRILTPTKYQFTQATSENPDQQCKHVSREPSFINQEDFAAALFPSVLEHKNKLVINLNQENLSQQTKTIESNPIILAITRNLHIHLEIIQLNLSNCTNNHMYSDTMQDESQFDCVEAWYFASIGMETIGCEEVVIILKKLPDENCPPIEIFHYFFQLYQRAYNNETKYDGLEMTVELFPTTNVRLKDWAGILHIRPTFQCLDKLPLPQSSFLIGILVHRWELPWAKILPLRLILALGNQSRYYPCSIVSDRNRSTVYEEISQTILQIISPIFSYATNFEQGILDPNTLPTVPGMWIHLMASQETIIQIPKLSYHNILNILSFRQADSNTLALVACFSREADSHLVCCQNEETCKYYSRAISIQHTERTVTGATMIIFVLCDNSSEHGATIVEDVLVVRLSLLQLSCVVNSLKMMSNLILQWDSNIAQINNKSFIKIVWTENHQFSEMAYIERPSLVTDETLQAAFLTGTYDENITLKSHRVPSAFQDLSPNRNSTNNINLKLVWTRFHYCFKDKSFKDALNDDPLDVDDNIRKVAICFSESIYKYLDLLREMDLVNFGLRITLEKNNVSYMVGCSKKPIYSILTPDQSPLEDPDSNQSSYVCSRLGNPRKFQSLSLCTPPDICIESLNDNFVPFLYSLTEKIIDNSITSELEFHIID